MGGSVVTGGSPTETTLNVVGVTVVVMFGCFRPFSQLETVCCETCSRSDRAVFAELSLT